MQNFEAGEGATFSALPPAQPSGSLALRQNRPNPFGPATTIRYSISEPCRVKIGIYNLLGQVVCTLVDEKRTPGEYAVTWAGRNSQGQTMDSGVYFYRLSASPPSGKAGGRVITRKMLYMH